MNNLLSTFRLILVISFAGITLLSCGDKTDIKTINGTADTILKDLYDKLIEKYEFVGKFEHGTIIVKQDKYGLLDYNGNEVIPCEYDSIYKLENNARIVKGNGKFGIVNEYASFIAECKYDSILSPSPKFIPILLNKKWGFYSENGDRVITFKYDDILEYNDSLFVAEYNKKYGISDYKDKAILEYKYDWIYYKLFDKATYVTYGDKMAIFNSKLKQVSENIYSKTMPNYFDEKGLASLKLDKNEKAGIIEVETGKTIIPFEYDDIELPSEGLICAKRNGKFGYVNTKNEVIIPFVYDDANSFSEGLALVGKNDKIVMTHLGLAIQKKYGFINKKGSIEIPFKFADQSLKKYSESGNGFHEGLAAIGKYRPDNVYAGYIGYINKKGDYVIKPQYTSATAFFCGVAVVQNIIGKYGAINKKGEVIVPLKYEYGCLIEKDSIIGMGYDYKIVDKYNLKGELITE